MTRRGFTLIELMVALLIAAIAVSAAAGTFGASVDAVEDLDARTVRWSSEAHGRRWLSELLASVDVGHALSSRFSGSSQAIRFRARYRVPEGWLETGTVSIRMVGRTLQGTMPDGSVIVLMDSLRHASFDYLVRYGAESPWLREWESATTAPLAVRLRVLRMESTGDTILFFIGRRG